MTQDMRSVSPVGSTGAGKTTFRQRLQGLPIEYTKTQVTETFASAIDAPGRYLEVGRYKHAPILISYDMGVVVLVQSATSNETHFPSGFVTIFNCEVLGIVTRTGVATEAQVHDVVDHLARAGAHRIVAIDSVTGKEFKRVQEMLCRTSS